MKVANTQKSPISKVVWVIKLNGGGTLFTKIGKKSATIV